jgi:hypothetical protein
MLGLAVVAWLRLSCPLEATFLKEAQELFVLPTLL